MSPLIFSERNPVAVPHVSIASIQSAYSVQVSQGGILISNTPGSDAIPSFDQVLASSDGT